MKLHSGLVTVGLLSLGLLSYSCANGDTVSGTTGTGGSNRPANGRLQLDRHRRLQLAAGTGGTHTGGVDRHRRHRTGVTGTGGTHTGGSTGTGGTHTGGTTGTGGTVVTGTGGTIVTGTGGTDHRVLPHNLRADHRRLRADARSWQYLLAWVRVQFRRRDVTIAPAPA